MVLDRRLGKSDGILVGLSWPGMELARQHAVAVVDVLETLDAVRVGTHMLGHATPSGVRGYTMVGGQLLWIEPDESLRITEELLFNPWVAIFDEQHLLKKVLANSHAGGRPKRLFPLPPIPPEELRALAALALPREAIVQRYLARLKAGGRLSGGPTSDQSWTIRWTEAGYRISSYQDDGEGLKT